MTIAALIAAIPLGLFLLHVLLCALGEASTFKAPVGFQHAYNGR